MKVLRVYVGVKYSEKEEAKKKGCKYDPEKKGWYLEYEIDDDANDILGLQPYKVEIIDSPKSTNKKEFLD